jgi:hypothetical protein
MVGKEKNTFVVRQEKNARQRFFVVSFGRRTAKTDLCCAPEIKHTTKTGFPVVLVASLL